MAIAAISSAPLSVPTTLDTDKAKQQLDSLQQLAAQQQAPAKRGAHHGGHHHAGGGKAPSATAPSVAVPAGAPAPNTTIDVTA